MRYCVVLASQYKTAMLTASARAVKEINVVYVVHPSRWSQKNFGYFGDCDDVTHLHWFDLEPSIDPQKLSSAQIEECIRVDRILRANNVYESIEYISEFGLRIQRLLSKGNCRFLLGEFTWGHEHAASFVAGGLNIPALYLDEVKVPSAPTAFLAIFDRVKETMLDPKIDVREAYNYNVNMGSSAGHQHYISSLMPQLGIGNWFRGLVQNLNIARLGGDKTVPPLRTLLRRRLSAICTSIGLMLMTIGGRPDRLGLDFCVFMLHRQPDSAIDVKPAHLQDQFKLLFELISNNPKMKFLLRFHPHERSFLTFLRCLYVSIRHTNVQVDFSRGSIFEQGLSIKCILSVAGTASLESYVHGIPGFVFADTYFSNVLGCKLDYPCNLSSVLRRVNCHDRINSWYFYVQGKILPGKIIGIFFDNHNLSKYAERAGTLLNYYDNASGVLR